jgi:soluble lytic murein transglycosylase
LILFCQKKVPLKIILVLCIGAAAVFCGIFFTARELYRRGTFVDDSRYFDRISSISMRHGVDPQLVRAVVFQESRFDSSAVGGKGEVGLMQLHLKGAVSDWAKFHKKKLPSHAALLDVDLNLEIGIWYLARALKRWEKYRDRIPLALIHYNAGAARAERWKPERFDGQVIPRIKISSTKIYVKRIMDRYHKYLREKQ